MHVVSLGVGAPERELIDAHLIALPPESRRFRLNAGQAWAGEVVRRTPTTITLRNPRVFHGAPEGFPDLCGWDAVVVTPDMVGTVVAIFAADEVKANGGRLSVAQKMFRACLERMGGRFRVVVNPADPRSRSSPGARTGVRGTPGGPRHRSS